jgi:ubiquinone/menaquinone biosynthesis C-methylase UbiE/N-acetylglutamate synthase-like GNAT family acetyltransferase
MKNQPDSQPATGPAANPINRPKTHAWSIRQPRPNDLTTVGRLLEQSGLPVDGVADHLDSSYMVAECAGEVIGSVGVEPYGRYGLARSLVVEPEWRGKGIGRILMEDRLRWARGRGLTDVFLITVTPQYFGRFGFEPVERDSVPQEIRNSAEFSDICSESATVMTLSLVSSDEDVRRGVRDAYAAIAKDVKIRSERDEESSCCGPACCGTEENTISSNLYSAGELTEIPDAAALASLGCGNPTALAELKTGEVVLDLGSGGGIDVLLSARRVGPEGKAYGLDMTDEMLDIARKNQKVAGVDNVEFLKGQIESIPLPDNTVDVVLSNCVINLSTDKRGVLMEAFRVLRPGGRFAVSDVVSKGDVPDSIRRDIELWAGCIAGSLEEQEYQNLLKEAGFEDIEVQPTRMYTAEDIGLGKSAVAGPAGESLDGMFMSAFIRAKKPVSE